MGRWLWRLPQTAHAGLFSERKHEAKKKKGRRGRWPLLRTALAGAGLERAPDVPDLLLRQRLEPEGSTTWRAARCAIGVRSGVSRVTLRAAWCTLYVVLVRDECRCCMPPGVRVPDVPDFIPEQAHACMRTCMTMARDGVSACARLSAACVCKVRGFTTLADCQDRRPRSC